MRVTVVIPTYNRASLIVETVESVLNQAFQDFEIVIVDDGSKDNTREVVENAFGNDERVRYHLQENAGAQAARNKGTELARGELVVYLDSDDLFDPKYLTMQVASFDADPELDGSIGQTLWFKEKPGDWPYVWNRIVMKDPFTSYLNQDVLWATAAGLWKKSFVEKMGGWRPNVKSSQDVDFHLRAAYHGHKIKFVPEILIHQRDHPGPRISGGNRHGWIYDVVEMTDFIYAEMKRDERLTPKHLQIIASNYLWCARKQARDATLPAAKQYLQKCLEVQPSAWRRFGIKLFALPALSIMNKFKPWYYVSYGVNRLLGLEVERFNWHQHYTVENWLQHSDLNPN